MRNFTVNERLLIIFKRKEAKLTIGQLSEELHMSKSNLSRIENGKIMVSRENEELLEKRFSINFSIDSNYYDKMLIKFEDVSHKLIFYKLFGEYTKEQVENANIATKQSIAYPFHILLCLYVYSAKNIEKNFCDKYINIFQDVFHMFEEKYQKIILISKMNILYFNKQYDESLEVCLYIENKFDSDNLFNSFLFHMKAIIYGCLGEKEKVINTVNIAIEYSTSVNNPTRLIALYITKANYMRLMGEYHGALCQDTKTMEYSEKSGVHIYDYILCRNKAWTYYLLNNYEDAIRFYKEAEQYDRDDDLCFMMALCCYKLNLRKQCKEYILKGRKTKNVGIAFPYLLDWLELSLNKKYSIKAEKKLLFCLKKYEDSMHVDSKNNIYRLLIDHYSYLNNLQQAEYYREKLKASLK